jgi:hypothetical protein
MPAAKLDFSDPASVVRGFIHQMHCWEAFAGALSAAAEARFRPNDDSTLHPEEVRVNELLKQVPPLIVATFLTAKARAVAPSCSYSTPPEYDPRVEKVTRVTPKTKTQVIVETDRKADYMGGVREYVLKKEGEAWLIDAVRATLGGKRLKLTLV